MKPSEIFREASPERGDYIIVLDLDHTLIFSAEIPAASTKDPFNDSISSQQSYLAVSTDQVANNGKQYHVYKRPYLDQFLKAMSEMGTLHIFTASIKAYADPIIDAIDPQGYITGRYYREHCVLDKKGQLIKNMDVVTKNAKKLIIIDDSIVV